MRKVLLVARGIPRDHWRDDVGATAIEYALIAGMIAVVIVAIVTAIGVDVLGLFTSVSEGFQSAQ
jgi:pilus assembly protein Flp/PilA